MSATQERGRLLLANAQAIEDAVHAYRRDAGTLIALLAARDAEAIARINDDRCGELLRSLIARRDGIATLLDTRRELRA